MMKETRKGGKGGKEGRRKKRNSATFLAGLSTFLIWMDLNILLKVNGNFVSE